MCDDNCCKIIETSSESESESYDSIDEMTLLPVPSANFEWTVYGAKWCKYCRMANLFLEGTPDYQYVDIEEYMTVSKFKELFDDKTDGYSTIPMVFKQDTFIGGYSDLLEINKN